MSRQWLGSFGLVDETTTGQYVTGGALIQENASTTYNDTLAEALTGAGAYSSLATFPNALTEALTGADSYTTTAAFVSALTEALTGADGYTVAITLAGALNEALTAADSNTTAGTFSVPLAEALTAAFNTSVFLDATLAETLTLTVQMALAKRRTSWTTEPPTSGGWTVIPPRLNTYH